MLVLSRQRSEVICIGPDIRIEVVDIRGDKVRLGVTAPTSMDVHREEIFNKIEREKRAAANMKPDDLPATIETHHMTRLGKRPTRGGLDHGRANG